MATQKRKLDKTLLFLIIFWVFYGLLILGSASIIKSQKYAGENYYYLKHQLVFGVLVGFLFFLLGLKIKYLSWRHFALPFFLFSIALLSLLFFPHFGLSLGGARRWLKLGSGHLTFQPAEVAKVAFILYLSAWLAKRKKDNINSFSKTILPFLVLNGLLGIFFLMQPDLGSLLVIYTCSLFLFILSGVKIGHILKIIALSAIIFLLLIVFSPYRMSRLTSFLNPGHNPLGSGYQVRQAIIGIGSGGLFGRGYGQSFQKRGYLPQAIGDSIFAVLVEELGFLGGTILVLSFLVLTFKGFRIAKRCSDDFGRFLASGISILVVSQAFINISAISGLIPLTGLPLPLVSYGSSSYVMTLFSLGILGNISLSNLRYS